jgi:hypothetical protein
MSSISCARHLNGTATFDVSLTSPRHPPLAGTLASGMLVTDPGHVALSIAFGDAPIALDLLDARVQITTTTAAGASGVIAGLVIKEQLDFLVVPAMAQALDSAITAECPPPTCVCVAGSNGEKLKMQFDTNGDCSVSINELRVNNLVHQLLDPDIMIDATTNGASFGIRFTAVNATFTP